MTQTTNKLYDEVLSDARTKAERELRRGQKDAEAEARKIEDKARATVEEILGAARAEGDRLRRQVLATVEVEAQRQRLARLEEILRSVYERTERRLGELSDQEQFDAQCRLTLEAVAQMPHDSLQVALPASSPAVVGSTADVVVDVPITALAPVVETALISYWATACPWPSASGQETSTVESERAVAVTCAGGSGTSALGVTGADRACGPWPIRLTAATLTTYGTPLVSPVRVTDNWSPRT